ncbi:GNAT family N-acetyltransferase [Rhodobacteraceae bacterium]|nr:GNAT family N-acetyltransferase [Paracoccaceae bacterium]
MHTQVLTGRRLEAVLDDVAALRIEVFRDWPYLYDGTLEYERSYLEAYRDGAGGVVVGAFDGTTLVGAATGSPLLEHAPEFGCGFEKAGIDPATVFYCAESVLLAPYRGQGIGHAFFTAREDHARALGYGFSAFCAVIRPQGHPLRPATYQPLDAFWMKRGYKPLPDVIARFDWKDIDQPHATSKNLQFWGRAL